MSLAPMRRSFEGATVVVSGAGGGLGRALALCFARQGARLALLDLDAAAVARVAGEIAALGQGEAFACPCDVTDEAACVAAVAAAAQRFGRIDVLVNNAGITHRSGFEATHTDVFRRVMEVNVFGAIHLTRAALPALKRNRGLIVAMSSVAGYTPLLARTGYAASKHALHGLFGSLRTELAPHGVDVMLVCPSFVATDIDRHALGAAGGTAPQPQVVIGRPLSPSSVAARVVDAATRRRRLVLIGRTAHVAWWLHRLAPALYERLMARRLRAELR
jgi:NAD(P)-dependent dehydrogenase (short-subunit alcohol dehydrogenase family)